MKTPFLSNMSKSRRQTSTFFPIIEKINKTNYTRKPEETILRMTKLETKTLITARYGMLECGKNFGGTIAGSCSECNAYDDENHRLNYCKRWKEIYWKDSFWRGLFWRYYHIETYHWKTSICMEYKKCLGHNESNKIICNEHVYKFVMLFSLSLSLLFSLLPLFITM